MLKNFIYLNTQALDSYLSSLEDGLRESTEDRTLRSRAHAGVEGVGSGASEYEQSRSRVDTPASKFERLQSLAVSDKARSGWIQVTDVEVDLRTVRTGALVELECDIYVPEAIKAFAPKGGMNDALAFMEQLGPHADLLGLDRTNMPTKPQADAMKSIAGLLGSDLVVVGERDDTDWRVAGRLLDHYVKGEVDGIARIVGKVTASWHRNQWKPLISLPGMNILPREQRRQIERTEPKPGQEQNYLEGPACMFDILAIYR